MFKSLLLKGRTLCLLLCCMISSLVVTAQTRHTGKVISSDDKLPVVGASVRIKGTNTGAVTDVNGDFTITVSPGNVLVISYIGYNSTEVTVQGNQVITISLQPANSTLNEVVVTGYTAQKKKDITGAVAIVDVASMNTVTSGNATSLLQGQASGVTVTNSGQPGAATSINIRGVGSIFSTAPLVVVDGVAASLDNINQEDIESIQILKDAGASAIYGVRAANGVIVVTTKKGKQGRAVVTYDGMYGTTQPLADGFKLANTQTYMQAEFLSNKYDGLTGGGQKFAQFDPTGSGTWSIPDFISPAGAHVGDPGTTAAAYTLNPLTGVGNQVTMANKAGTDWFHVVFKAAPIQQHNITVSGGGDKSSYLMSLGYLNQQGTLQSIYEKRYSLRVNNAYSIGDHIRVGENAYLFYKQNPTIGNQNEGNLVSYIYREPPIIPLYDIAGNFAGTRSASLSNSSNPFAIATRNAMYNTPNDWQMIGNMYAEVDFLKHFTLHTSIGGTIDNYYYHNFGADAYENAEGNTGGNSYTEGAGYNSNYTWQNTLKYGQILGKHSINLLVGSEAITSYGRQVQASRGGYISADPNFILLNTGLASTQQNNNPSVYSNTLMSYFARLEYAFNDKYLLQANVRRDGSSFFSPGHQYGTFPSATIGWRISKEDFMKGVSWVNDLKLRGGYGELGSLGNVGNQPYNAYNLYGFAAGNSFYDINGTSTSSTLGLYKTQVGNTNTTWQTDKDANVGLDATLFNNALDFSVDVYKKSISGFLFQQTPLAPGADAAAPYVNAGNIENTGIDFSTTYHGHVNDLKFNLSLNLSHYNNNVKSLANGTPYLDQNSSGSTRLQNFVRLQPGQPVGEFFGYQEIGLYQSAAEVAGSAGYAGAKPGLIKYRDVNGDGKIDANDRTFIGNPNPKISGGFNINASYKGFDLNAFFYGIAGNKVANYVKYWTDFPQVFDGNVSADIIAKSWNPTPGANNSQATIPVLTRQANLGNTASFSSYYLEDGSFLKLKSLQLGYTIPSNDLKRYGISKFRIYVRGNNLFTLTHYDGLDPELQPSNLNSNTSFGIDFGNYPSNEKQYTVGVQVTF
ncbi:MAG: SusC/RagA family TonB-linked outer membrane protein [Mucilaginibacter sp.]|nr:SusC/RagA family TonB-linked outer membrane protein [Mucilaginibacter sp.]